jgi:rhodanese-related sulfurtransferase
VAEDEDRVLESRIRLARVGHENIRGYLAGGVLSWYRAGLPLASIEQITADELDRRIKEGVAKQIVDVRLPGEWRAGHIKQALHLPLHHLKDNIGQLERDVLTAVICAGGYRSSVATSILEQEGFCRITNVVGGMSAWTTARLDTVQ